MEKLISNGKFVTDQVARTLLETLERDEQALGLDTAVFYYDFPMFRDYEDDYHRPSVMILSDTHGVIALRVINAAQVVGQPELLIREDEDLSQFFSILYGRLLKSRILRKDRNQIVFPINAALYAPGADRAAAPFKTANFENRLCASQEQLLQLFQETRVRPFEPDVIAEARSIIEGAKALGRPRPREIPAGVQAPKARALMELEAEIANFDAEQRRAAITVLNGPQRIRGLAGTGKTIVLAMKAAQLHLNEPTKKILYTFYTKSLYDLIKRLITRFYRHYKDQDPDWDFVKVLHGWGGTGTDGVYYRACIDHGIRPLKWRDVPATAKEPFNFICGDLLSKATIRPTYDHILIDEAQDFQENFFKLSYSLAVGERDAKSIVWAYDELQNIFDIKLRSAKDMFGVDDAGTPLIDLERAAQGLPRYMSNDIVLHKSYRNPKEVLVSAHALGFGLYSQQIVQMLENREHWEDIGYRVIEGTFETGSPTIVVRPDENSPLSISARETKESLIQWQACPDLAGECDWVAEQIKSFIREGLKPEDLLVISLDDRNARTYFSAISRRLIDEDIVCNNVLDNPYSTIHFAVDGKVTLSTVHRAKGNEAAAVLAVGIDAIFPRRNSRTGRNKIFTALTRAKAWLRVSGVGVQAKAFLDELEKAVALCPKLQFTFPDLKEVDLLQRDVSKKEARLIHLKERFQKELEKLGLEEEEVADFFASEEKR